MRFLDLDIFFNYYYYLSTSLKTSKKWQRPFFFKTILCSLRVQLCCNSFFLGIFLNNCHYFNLIFSRAHPLPLYVSPIPPPPLLCGNMLMSTTSLNVSLQDQKKRLK